MTGGISVPAPLRLADQDAQWDPYCESSTPDNAYAGAIVICYRGFNLLTDKSWNVAQRGAIGMVLYDPDANGAEHSDTASHVIPSIHLDAQGSALLYDLLAQGTPLMATFTAGAPVGNRDYVLADLSSRGDPAMTATVMKPDVAAPGIEILAGDSPEHMFARQRDGELFQVINGTSMASPHVAGAAALLKQKNPSWTPGQLKSALMTSANGKVRDGFGRSVAPSDTGSGRLQLKAAMNPGLTFDVPVQDYVDHATDLWNVNYPSVFLPVESPDVITVYRTAKSQLSTATTWKLRISSRQVSIPTWGLKNVVVVPPSVSVPAGGTATFPISIDKRTLRSGYDFATLKCVAPGMWSGYRLR